jgi:hypothetical protein
MELLLHSSEWLIIFTNGLLAHVTITSVKAVNHDYHYIHPPKVWRSVYCNHLKGRTRVR